VLWCICCDWILQAIFTLLATNICKRSDSESEVERERPLDNELTQDLGDELEAKTVKQRFALQRLVHQSEKVEDSDDDSNEHVLVIPRQRSLLDRRSDLRYSGS